jgi:hypothetical protein
MYEEFQSINILSPQRFYPWSENAVYLEPYEIAQCKFASIQGQKSNFRPTHSFVFCSLSFDREM